MYCAANHVGFATGSRACASAGRYSTGMCSLRVVLCLADAAALPAHLCTLQCWQPQHAPGGVTFLVSVPRALAMSGT
jgi:hypothetical protein